MNHFNSITQQLMNCFPVDEEFEHYVRAWMAYHEAAEKVDGAFGPCPPAKFRTMAVRAGWEAMSKVFPLDARPSLVVNNPSCETYAKWNHAKLEALRRLNYE